MYWSFAFCDCFWLPYSIFMLLVLLMHFYPFSLRSPLVFVILSMQSARWNIWKTCWRYIAHSNAVWCMNAIMRMLNNVQVNCLCHSPNWFMQSVAEQWPDDVYARAQQSQSTTESTRSNNNTSQSYFSPFFSYIPKGKRQIRYGKCQRCTN